MRVENVLEPIKKYIYSELYISALLEVARLIPKAGIERKAQVKQRQKFNRFRPFSLAHFLSY